MEIECASCHQKFEVSYRHANEIHRRDLERKCGPCRRPGEQPCVTDELLDWWRRRYSEKQIVVMAEDIWGPREDWPPRSNPMMIDFGVLTAVPSGKVSPISDN